MSHGPGSGHGYFSGLGLGGQDEYISSHHILWRCLKTKRRGLATWDRGLEQLDGMLDVEVLEEQQPSGRSSRTPSLGWWL